MQEKILSDFSLCYNDIENIGRYVRIRIEYNGGFMMEMLSVCKNPSLTGILTIVKRVLLLIQIIVPILLIIYASYGMYQLMKNPDRKNGTKEILNKFLAAGIIFFIPLFLNVVMGMVGEKTDFSSCWNQANFTISTDSTYYELTDREREPILNDTSDYEKGNPYVSLKYSDAVEIPDRILKKTSHSDLSIVVVDWKGNVLAQRKPLALREGGSTMKVFTGYAAVKLLDPEKDTVICTSYAQNMPYMGEPDVRVGQTFSVAEAATRDFPGSSNITTANIAIAIGKKLYDCSSDEEAYFKGMDAINAFIKKVGCYNSCLPSSSGVNYNYKLKKFVGNQNGLATDIYGISANDLALVTIEAMKDSYFASGISGRDKDGLFFIKSGTQAYKHGVWGFNYKGNRYYIAALGFNFKEDGDVRSSVVNDIYNWTTKSLIK